MVSFTAAVTALLAVVSITDGFTSYTSNKRSATILQSTTSSESYQFQRSLLEAQLSNSGLMSIPAEHVVTSINGSTEEQVLTIVLQRNKHKMQSYGLQPVQIVVNIQIQHKKINLHN